MTSPIEAMSYWCVTCRRNGAIVELTRSCKRSDCNVAKDITPLTADSPIDPVHYRSHPSGVECITITRHMNFNLGNAVAYIWRAGKKNNTVEDLKKAIWHLEDEIKRLDRGKDEPSKEGKNNG